MAYSSMSVLIVTTTRLLSATSSFCRASSFPVLRQVAYPTGHREVCARLGQGLILVHKSPWASVLPPLFHDLDDGVCDGRTLIRGRDRHIFVWLQARRRMRTRPLCPP